MIHPPRFTDLIALAGVLCVLAQAESMKAGLLSSQHHPKIKQITSDGVEVDVRGGIANQVDDNLPMPLIMTVSNTTAEPIDAVWEVEFLDYAYRQLRAVRKEVELPANMKTSRRTRLYLKREAAIIVVRLLGNSEVLWQSVIDGEPFFPTCIRTLDRAAINILTVSPNRERLRFAARKEAAFATMPDPGQRKAVSCAIRSWELPTHSPPLCMFKAVVISKDADLSLSPGQARALADYLVFGGTIVVPGSKSPALELLKSNLPPAAVEDITEAVDMKTPAPTRIGSGMLLFDAEDYFLGNAKSTEAASNLVKLLEYEAEPAFPKFLRPGKHVRVGLPGNASKSLSMVGIVFVLYALLTGPVIWLLLRKRSRKALAAYLGITISVFCLIALLVGPILGLRKGDIQWLSVTELTPNGGYQWTMLSMTSAGGKNHQIELQGNRLRSWLLPATVTNDARFTRSWGGGSMPNRESMNISMDLFAEGIQQKKQDVQLSPWGTRILLTNSYLPQARQVDVRVDYSNQRSRIVVANNSNLDLLDSKIITSYWAADPGEEKLVVVNTGDLMHDVRKEFDSKSIDRLNGNRWGRTTLEMALAEYVPYYNWERTGGCASLIIPRTNLNATPNAYFVARVASSPSLKIGSGSFEPNLGTHLVVQRIELNRIINPQALVNPLAGY
jgi:hypothetical protein